MGEADGCSERHGDAAGVGEADLMGVIVQLYDGSINAGDRVTEVEAEDCEAGDGDWKSEVSPGNGKVIPGDAGIDEVDGEEEEEEMSGRRRSAIDGTISGCNVEDEVVDESVKVVDESVDGVGESDARSCDRSSGIGFPDDLALDS